MLLITSLFQWWYGDGLRERMQIIASRMESMIDYFSFGLLLKTLFAPYRQISAGTVDGSMEVKMRAMLDKLFSRVIGAVIRLMIMTVGALVMGVLVIYNLIGIIIWGILPLFPIVGIILMVIGWVPEWIK